MRPTTAAWSMSAIKRMRCPHRGHTSTSNPKPRRINSAHDGDRVSGRVARVSCSAWVGVAPLLGSGSRARSSDDVGSPRGARSEDAMVEDQVDARTRRDDREAFQQFERLEQHVSRAVRPRVPQRERHQPIRRHPQTFLGDWRPQRVPAEPLQPMTMLGGSDDAGVQVEPVAARVSTRRRGGRAFGSDLPHAPQTSARARPAGDPALNGGGTDAGEDRRLLGPPVWCAHVFIIPKTTPLKQAVDPAPGALQHSGDLRLRECGSPVEDHPPGWSPLEDAVEHQRVHVDVQVQGRPESLQDGDGAATAVRDTGVAGAGPQEAQHGAYEYRHHRPAQLVIPSQQIAEARRQAQHPLTNGHRREDVVYEVGRALNHPASAVPRPCSGRP